MATKKKPIVSALSIMEAVDNLTSMAELEPVSMKKEKMLSKGGEDERLKSLKWLDLQDQKSTISSVKNTFKAVKNYMENVYSNEEGLRDIETQKGLKAIMTLAGEAVEQLDKCTTVFKDAKIKIADFEEFNELQEFYKKKILARFKLTLEKEETWLDEWGTGDVDVLDIKRKGLRDLETVKKDKSYELLYIRKEDGKPYFNKNLVRHIKLVTNFDGLVSDLEGDDPLLRIKIIQDRNSYATACEIKEEVFPLIKIFYGEAQKYRKEILPRLLRNAIMALLLAANPRNLLQNTTGKSCYSYMIDFHSFIRQVTQSTDYIQLISSPPEIDSFYWQLQELLSSICYALFVRIGDRNEVTAFIRRMVERVKGKKSKRSRSSSISIWNQLLDDHEHLDKLLEQYPNGPLMKTLDLFIQRDDVKGFDPIGQENLPHRQFQFEYGDLETTCIRLPCPTYQQRINKAGIIEEYQAFLRHGAEKKNHLLINLQDRTSWKEHARCKVLEDMQNKAEFSSSLKVITLSKNTEFYLQSEDYIDQNDAKSFIQTAKDQISSGEACGFYFPKSIEREILPFTKKAIDLIHKLFFGKNQTLTRKNRLDFIEILYQFIVMKCIDLTKPNIISFTCKDAVDIGPTSATLFFGFLKLLSSKPEFSGDDLDFLQWSIFAPALTIRERPIEIGCLSRMVSAISVIHAEQEINRKKLIKAIEALFGYPIFQEVKLLE